MRALVPDQRAYIGDVRAKFTLDCVRVLMEWQDDISACFQEKEVHLAEGVNAQVILLQSEGDAEQASGRDKGLAGTDSCGARAPSHSLYADMSLLVESLVKNGSATANQGYRRLCFFSGQIPIPQGEEEFETWRSQATQAVEVWSVP